MVLLGITLIQKKAKKFCCYFTVDMPISICGYIKLWNLRKTIG